MYCKENKRITKHTQHTMRNVKTAYGTMSAENTKLNQYASRYTVTAPCGTFIGTVDVWENLSNKKSYDPILPNGSQYASRRTLAEACSALAIAFYSAQSAAQMAADAQAKMEAKEEQERAEIGAQEQDEIAAEQVALEQAQELAQAPAESVQFEQIQAVKAGRFYDIFELATGTNLGFIEASNGVFYTYGRAFGTLEKAANYLAKQVLEVLQIEHENGQALSDLQAQTDHDIYCAREYEQELEREKAARQMYEQAPIYTPKKIILGLADGTAKIVLDTGETRLIPAIKQAENQAEN